MQLRKDIVCLIHLKCFRRSSWPRLCCFKIISPWNLSQKSIFLFSALFIYLYYTNQIVPAVELYSTERIPHGWSNLALYWICRLNYYRLLANGRMQINFSLENFMPISENCCKRCFSSGEDLVTICRFVFLPLLVSLSKLYALKGMEGNSFGLVTLVSASLHLFDRRKLSL